MAGLNSPDDVAGEGTSVARQDRLSRWTARIYKSPNYKWIVQGVISINILMACLDQGMLNVSLPTMTTELRTDLTTIQWVVTGQLLAIASTLLAFGRLGDFLGRGRVFTAGFGLFTVATALCGMSQTVEQLIFFRVLQGIGGAMILGNHQAIITSVFPITQLGQATGVAATVVATGTMLGPATGGFIVELFDWRTAFLLRVPIGVIGTALAIIVLRPVNQTKGRFQFDFLGAFTIGVSIIALLLATSQGETRGWFSPSILGLFATFLVFLIVFLVRQARIDEPLVDLSVFQIRMFSTSTFSQFINFFSLFAISVLVPFYLVQAAGYQPSHAGLILSAQPLVMAFTSPFSGWLSDRMGSRLLTTAGLSFACLGLLLLSGVGTQTPPAYVAVQLGLVGLGTGLFQPANNRAMMGSIPRDKIGVASAFVPLMRNLGSVLGVGVLSAVFASRIVAYGGQLSSNRLLGQLAEPEVMVVAFRDTFIVAAVICALGVLVSLSRGDRETTKAAGKLAQPKTQTN